MTNLKQNRAFPLGRMKALAYPMRPGGYGDRETDAAFSEWKL